MSDRWPVKEKMEGGLSDFNLLAGDDFDLLADDALYRDDSLTQLLDIKTQQIFIPESGKAYIFHIRSIAMPFISISFRCKF